MSTPSLTPELSKIPELTSGSIKSIKALSHDHPVFEVTLTSGFVLVVKGDMKRVRHAEEQAAYGRASSQQKTQMDAERESQSQASIAWGSKIMKNVTGRKEELRTKPLTVNEFQEVTRAVKQGLSSDPKARAWIADNDRVWVKMPFISGLHDANIGNIGDRTGLTKEDKADKIEKNVMRVMPLLLNAEMWHELGEITAVDLFIGNNDRFVIRQKDLEKPRLGSRGDVKNPGNIFLLTGRIERAIALGLDTFDFNSATANLKAKWENNADEVSKLQILIDKQARLDFAAGCARGVGEDLFGQLHKLTELSTFTCKVGKIQFDTTFKIDELPALFEGFKDVFALGIEMGANKLKTYLQSKVRQQNWSKEPSATKPKILMGLREKSSDSSFQAGPPLPSGQLPPPSSPLPISTRRPPAPSPFPVGQLQPSGPTLASALSSPQLFSSPTPQASLAATSPMQPRPYQQIPQGIEDRMKYLKWWNG